MSDLVPLTSFDANQPDPASDSVPGESYLFSKRLDRRLDNLKRTSNQCRGNTSHQWKHLSFRSPHEVAIAETLDALGVMFFPNTAVRLTIGDCRVTKEVDFLICKDGRWGILEVDGQQHLETVEEDRTRDDAFNDHGVWFIRRYAASICKEKPVFVAKDFVRRLDAFYSHFRGN